MARISAADFSDSLIPGVVESHMMKLFEKFDISMKTQLEQLREAQVTHLQLDTAGCSWNRDEEIPDWSVSNAWSMVE